MINVNEVIIFYFWTNINQLWKELESEDEMILLIDLLFEGNRTPLSIHLVRLNRPIPTNIRDISGLSLSPMTAALRMIPLNPLLWDYTKLGQIALTYDAVQIMNNTTIIILSKLKNAL